VDGTRNIREGAIHNCKEGLVDGASLNEGAVGNAMECTTAREGRFLVVTNESGQLMEFSGWDLG